MLRFVSCILFVVGKIELVEIIKMIELIRLKLTNGTFVRNVHNLNAALCQLYVVCCLLWVRVS